MSRLRTALYRRSRQTSTRLSASRVINVDGNIVIPGMIDLHTHVYEGINQNGINPDLAGVRSGVTTVLDAGSAGCYTFGGFPRYIVPRRQDEHLLHAAYFARWA